MDKKKIRAEIRHRRRTLSPQQQRQAAEGLSRQVSNLAAFRHARRIALYLGNDGEIDPLPTLLLAEAAGKRCYLPVLHPLKHNRIHFVPYRSGDRLTVSHFGYPEPTLAGSRITPAWAMDLILMPLVAFDASGNRIGMGGGFYDRTLAFTKVSPRRPTLIGLAHSCQQLDEIAANPWDIPLDAIATESRVISCR
ncbi:5-formyltetrahydrofolate cyclo-ligase [Porticoccus sp. W117]|uniref:5-formyltetrahydrofolate cyclo-ligase n=1 Tax=Porticoccus sp. W117 TaxID=3054777 RepID=UPI002595F7E1|nr:5-formyltetrahydrofolate cyclo-ligase [Porticoccus sp. W117]MDM3872028.1 5-formyltetrahydrofolate cyclo-ligase [Porticoccus sp. W117]